MPVENRFNLSSKEEIKSEWGSIHAKGLAKEISLAEGLVNSFHAHTWQLE